VKVNGDSYVPHHKRGGLQLIWTMMLSLTNTGEGTTPSSSESELNDSLTAPKNVGTVFENEGAGNVENGTSDRTNQNMSENMRYYCSGTGLIGQLDSSNTPIDGSEFEVDEDLERGLMANPTNLSEDKRVPMNLIPYNKKNIDDKFCQSVYRYRHLFCKSAGGTWRTVGDVDDFKKELENMYEQLLKEGRSLYEVRILQLAKSMGITRRDKQDCKSWRDVMKWALHADNHTSVEMQEQTMRTLIELFHIKLDGNCHDFWLQAAVIAWEVGKGVTVETDPMFEGNSIFGRQRSGPCFVRALYKRANLDTYIQSLREKLKRVYNLGFSRRKGCGKDATNYRTVMIEGVNVGYIVECHGITKLSEKKMLHHTGGVSALSWRGDCFENINKENNNAMDLATLLKTFRNGLIAHGEYAKAREVARWMEEDQQCVNEHQVGVGGGTQSGNDGDTTMVSMEDEEEESNLRGGGGTHAVSGTSSKRLLTIDGAHIDD
jgi:hypothetical protein